MLLDKPPPSALAASRGMICEGSGFRRLRKGSFFTELSPWPAEPVPALAGAELFRHVPDNELAVLD
jgi:hypothetical protein